MSEAQQASGQPYLVHAVTGTTSNPIVEQIRSKGAEVVLAIFRLVKIGLVHDIKNDAVTRCVESTHRIIVDFCEAIGTKASLTFVDDVVFVCGQLLRASRGVYQSAIELGALLDRAGVSEITIEPDVVGRDLRRLSLAVSLAVRDPTRKATVVDAAIPHITLRAKDPMLAKREKQSALPVKERIVRMYASALVVMRRFLSQVAAGVTVLPQRVKRVGQSLVGLSALEDPALLGMTVMATVHRDDASRAVHTAILAVVVARRITRDRLALARLATAALMADAGRAVIAGAGQEDRLVQLSESDDARVPLATSELAITTGGVNFPNALRTVITFEATWLERQAALGPPYEGAWTPLVQSRLLALVRALFDRLAPRDISEALSPQAALRSLAEDPEVDPVLLRTLVRAVGVIPAGSVVELDTGAWAVIVSESANEAALDRSRVAIVTEPNGRALVRPRELDLGVEKGPRIVRVLGPSAAKFNAGRIFLGPPPRKDTRAES